MPALSVVMPYYCNPRMLTRQMVVWKKEWGSELLSQIEIILVDDGSPEEKAEDVIREMWEGEHGLPLSLYRVLEDRPWHQHGARNLGAHVAQSRWLLMTDMDHVIPGSTLAEVLRLTPKMSKREVLTFGRVDAPATLTWRADQWTEFQRTVREDGSLKPHVNSFAVRKKVFWYIGAYDEDLCGIYGTDKHFRNRLFGSSVARHLEHAPLIRVGREVIPDASTRNVERKVPGRSDLKKAAAAGKSPGQTTTLNFPWERVL
jgi:hypothetical protein